MIKRSFCIYFILMFILLSLYRGETSSPGEEPFREWYSRLGEIRSLVPSATLLALTATASRTLRRRITTSLGMVDVYEELDNPDRENIKLFSTKVSSSAEVSETFTWLSSALCDDDCPRTIVFCKTIADCSRLYNMCLFKGSIDMGKVEMFHSMTPAEVKNKIGLDMANVNGVIRVLFCTNAAGMGVNYKSVFTVISYGPPQDMDTFVQHMGRAARDGSQGIHLLLYHARHLRNVDTDVLLYVKNTEHCRRKILLASYSSTVDDKRIGHLCCDICDQKCTCQESCPRTPHNPSAGGDDDDDESDDEQTRCFSADITEAHLRKVRQQLHSYRQSKDEDKLFHGMTDSVIQQVVSNLTKLDSVDSILHTVDVWSFQQAADIFQIINSVLQVVSNETVSDVEYLTDDDH